MSNEVGRYERGREMCPMKSAVTRERERDVCNEVGCYKPRWSGSGFLLPTTD